MVKIDGTVPEQSDIIQMTNKNNHKQDLRGDSTYREGECHSPLQMVCNFIFCVSPEKLKRLKIWLVVGVAIALLSISLYAIVTPTTPVTANATPGKKEVRGVWITNVSSNVLFTPWAINRALRQLSLLNFNTVYPVTWNRGNTFYPSDVAQKVTGQPQDPTLTVFRLSKDVLKEIFKQSHRQGLRVIPWFEYGFMAPINSVLVKRHPQWVTTSFDKNRNFSEGFFELELKDLLPESDEQSLLTQLRQSLSIQNVWLNPIHPQVQNFILDLILEVVKKYDVDGIQIDDRFGMPVQFGYDPITVYLYRQQHQGKMPPEDFTDPEWVQWRANQITAFMERIYKSIKAVKPNCIVSVSSNPYDFAYKLYLQDWQTWIERGLVDEFILQVYREELPSFVEELEQPAVKIAKNKIPFSIGILAGTLKTFMTIEKIQQQVKAVRDRNFAGVSFFYWETLWSYMTPDSPQERRVEFKKMFPTAVSRPK
ncbi:glycoside hydrolase family 10 protein [Okeania sp. SIO3I5]|uniref:glycoside hydrolase family 10 protein n=1 Tax=Okeania sp. SIO3I5 TaxID=2607805 RepID=UPI0025F92BBB|nr:glycoside hydrolase family 10 protein [Okeania sp. SIO3I5]